MVLVFSIPGRSATGVEQMSLCFIQIPNFILNLKGLMLSPILR